MPYCIGYICALCWFEFLNCGTRLTTCEPMPLASLAGCQSSFTVRDPKTNINFLGECFIIKS